MDFRIFSGVFEDDEICGLRANRKMPCDVGLCVKPPCGKQKKKRVDRHIRQCRIDILYRNNISIHIQKKHYNTARIAITYY